MGSKAREIKRLRDTEKTRIDSDYSCGLYNGLELALSVLEAREPVFESFEADPIVYEGKEEKPGRTVYSGLIRRNKKEVKEE